jgi:tetratricopeptide (TPR) repeat protein
MFHNVQKHLSIVVIATLALAVLGPAPAVSADTSANEAAPSAQPKPRRLNQLFATLKDLKDRQAAKVVVSEIWMLWGRSGRNDIDAMMRDAMAKLNTSQLGRALALFDQIVKRAPGFAEGWNKRATVLYFLNQHERSLADIAKVLALEPRHFGALSGKGAILMAQKKYHEALEVYRRAMAINPAMDEARSIVPMLKMMVGEKET